MKFIRKNLGEFLYLDLKTEENDLLSLSISNKYYLKTSDILMDL